jgi:hypothetical protein
MSQTTATPRKTKKVLIQEAAERLGVIYPHWDDLMKAGKYHEAGEVAFEVRAIKAYLKELGVLA